MNINGAATIPCNANDAKTVENNGANPNCESASPIPLRDPSKPS